MIGIGARRAWMVWAAVFIAALAAPGCASGHADEGASAPPARDSTPESDRETLREVQRERPR